MDTKSATRTVTGKEAKEMSKRMRQGRLFPETDTALARRGDAYLEAKDDAENAKTVLATSETALIAAMREAHKETLVHGGRRFCIVITQSKEKIKVT